METLWNCFYPKDDPLFEAFTKEEFDLLTALDQHALLKVSDTHATYQALDQLEQRQQKTIPLATAITLLKRINNEQQARFFPKEQFDLYSNIRYGNRSITAVPKEHAKARIQSTLLREEHYKSFLFLCCRGQLDSLIEELEK